MYAKTSLSILLFWLLAVIDAEPTEIGAYLNNPKDKPKNKNRPGHGKKIKVDFVSTQEPLKWTYIGIYKSRSQDPVNELPSDDLLHSWLNDCNNQTDCSYDPENAPIKGQVVFSLKPYSDEGDNELYFPLNGGDYRICLIDWTLDIDDDCNPDCDPTLELKAPCETFQVKYPKKKQKKKAVVTTPTDTAVGESIYVKVKTPVRVVNQWVGLYSVDDLKFPVTGPLPAEKLWAYTHCEENTGNVLANESCSKKRGKTKTIAFDKKSTYDCDNCKWPLAKGKYRACVNFNTNDPFVVYKCSGEFSIN